MEKQQYCSLISKNVRRYRKEKKYTQKQLADAIFVTQQYISEIERGNREPRMGILASLAGIFEVEVANLFKR